MSGRSRWVRDGEVVVGFRKTDRRNPRPKRGALGLDRQPGTSTTPEYPVLLAFQLPRTVLVAPGQLGFNITADAKGNVQVRARTTAHAYELARAFLDRVAGDRPAFTSTAEIRHDDSDRTYSRHLTVLRGSLIITAGHVAPQVIERP